MQELFNEIAPHALAAQNAIQGLVQDAFADRITPLLNGEALARLAVARDRRPAFGVIFMDLSGFKAINDSHGHEAGDAALRESGTKIHECAKQHGLLAFRKSGDEFVLIADDAHTAKDCAKAIAELFSLGVVVPYVSDGRTIELPRVKGSVGLCIRQDNKATMKELIERADKACRVAKYENSTVPQEWDKSLADDEVDSIRRRCESCGSTTSLQFRKKERREDALSSCANCGVAFK